MSELSDALKRVLSLDEDPFGIPGIVVPGSIDMVNYQCDVAPISGESTYSGVSFVASPFLVDSSGNPSAIPANGIIMVPKEGSMVIMQLTGKNTGYVGMFSALQSIQMLDGSFGGLVEVASLVSRINSIENLLNDLISKFNSHSHLLTLSSGTGTAAITTNQETGTISPITTRGNIENVKITHGMP